MVSENDSTTPTSPTRERRTIEHLRLPPCPIPRPGERVVWYTDAVRRTGVMIGHGPGGGPVVQNDRGYPYRFRSFNQVRVAEPGARVGPSWENMPVGAGIVAPHQHEAVEFQRILNQHIPPGPTYLELVHEIWSRGFEIFLVGGTVRDVLARAHTNDVDIVTSIPLAHALPLLGLMYRGEPSVDENNGFVRLGGTPASRDPFIDLKSFVLGEPGTDNALFGANFDADIRHRDFACNAVYYDPINNVLLDPSGVGIEHAEQRKLHLVADPELRGPFHRAQIAVRFFKFRCRGYTFSAQTETDIRTKFLPSFGAMATSWLISYLRTQLLSKIPVDEHEEQMDRLGVSMCEFGAKREWETRIAPILKDVLRVP